MEVDVQYVTDNNGIIKNVILPIDFWNRINCEDETDYLLNSPVNKSRLLESLTRNFSMTKKEVYERIGI